MSFMTEIDGVLYRPEDVAAAKVRAKEKQARSSAEEKAKAAAEADAQKAAEEKAKAAAEADAQKAASAVQSKTARPRNKARSAEDKSAG